MIGIGLAGYGHWGPNLARNLAAAGASIVAISDTRQDRLASAQATYPDAKPLAQWRDFFRHPGVDAVVVATPPATHFEIAHASLSAGKHVLVEKPIATSSEQTRRLIDAAARRGLTLMVDHTFLYSGGVRAIRGMIADGSVGDLLGYNGVRISPHPPSKDVDVIWDLGAHDLSIMDYLFAREPTAVAATGLAASGEPVVDDAYLTVAFGPSSINHVHVSWLSPVKIRRVLIGCERRMIVYDDMEPAEKIRVREYDAGQSDPSTPPLDVVEPLAAVAREFLDCIATGRRSLTDGEAGLRVVQVLEVASASLRQGGRMLRFPEGTGV
jgi:predicted dehydrogenase